MVDIAEEKKFCTSVKKKYSSPFFYFNVKLVWRVLTMILHIINYKKIYKIYFLA